MTGNVDVVSAWYNLQADLGFELPGDLAPATTGPRRLRVLIPPSLIRQERGSARWFPIPDEVADVYSRWRPTPLRRAYKFEQAIKTGSRILYKYEGGNLSGSHKLNTAVAQAYYYLKAGAGELVVGTGAGQWGTAVASACANLGLRCTVFMVRSSSRSKPYRATVMRLLGAEVIESPSDRTSVGRSAMGGDTEHPGTLSIALGEAQEYARDSGGNFCTGSGEGYSLLHQTVIGLECRSQLDQMAVSPDVITACLGGGSNFGGLTFPFIGAVCRGELSAGTRFVAAEPAACPTLTRGRYAYDFTDASQSTALQKMYTLGHTYTPPGIHAGGLRYHGSSKLVSALLDRGMIEACAYGQQEVFETAVAFLRTEGVLPAPESAHAIHSARQEAYRLDATGGGTVLTCVSGHGLFDLAAYEGHLNGTLAEAGVDNEIARSLAQLPDVTALARMTPGRAVTLTPQGPSAD